MGKIFVFIEGGRSHSQHQFWTEVNNVIYNGQLVLIPCGGIYNVLKYLYTEVVVNKSIKSTDIIIIDIDNVADNLAAQSTIGKLKDTLSGIYPINNTYMRLSNYYIFDTVCFEDMLLKCKGLFNWVHSWTERRQIYDKSKPKVNGRYPYTKVHMILNIYKEYLSLGDHKEQWRNNNILLGYVKEKYHGSLLNISTENVAALLLNDITLSPKSMLIINKGGMGLCYKIDCHSDKCLCKIRKKKHGKIGKENTCGLYFVRHKGRAIWHELKIAYLYKNSDLNRQISIAKRSLSSYPIASNLVVLP